MTENSSWGRPRSSLVQKGMIVRVALAILVMIGGIALVVTLVSSHLNAHASGAITPGPVNSTWYFADGKVGKGYNEYLTLNNPNPTNACSVNIQYLYTLDNGTVHTLTVPVAVPVVSRVSESTNSDLQIPSTQTTGAAVSAIITVNTAQTPSCSGIVAEQVMVFNHSGINSGTDVMGATHLGTNFYVADVPNGGGYSSYFAIMNASASSASITVTYYARGLAVGSVQTTVAAMTRGTVYAANTANLPRHSAAVVTSTQPVEVERTTYFTNINGGNAGTVSGAWTVFGSQALATDWLFAEGHTGGHYEENLVISNLDPSNTAATVTITLEYTDGTNHPFQITIGALSQVVWNVKQHNTGHSPSVSVEVNATTNVVVSRQMFFNYSSTHNNTTLTVAGGTEVVGQVGPAAYTSYSFAEGNTNTGYNTWLTLQNPTASAETIKVTLVNELGRVYTQGFSVAAHSRISIDVTTVVQNHLVQPGDGSQAYSIWEITQTAPGAPFIAERTVFWNTTGTANATQAGTDVFGYPGN